LVTDGGAWLLMTRLGGGEGDCLILFWLIILMPLLLLSDALPIPRMRDGCF
jgi:hypothetical protein